jgi:hypothetical protein
MVLREPNGLESGAQPKEGIRRENVSPDGKLKINWGYFQGRMSHEMWAPKITEIETG